MQLIKLQVLDRGIEVRAITFKEGINIVTNKEEDGNQIGKSTALRVLNFCLGSDGKSIWKDPDSKTLNQDIYNFVTGGNVDFVLELLVRKTPYRIKRRIVALQQKARTVLKIYSRINDDEYDTNDKFQAALAPVLGFSIHDPTYGAIKSRFVRLDKTTSRNTYRYLNVNTQDKAYISYYSYLFGFLGHADLSRELQLVNEVNERQARVSSLLNGKTEQEFKDKLKSIDDEIDVLNQKESDFDFKDVQNTSIARLQSVRHDIASITSDITRIEIKINYAHRTIDNYESMKSDVDVKKIEEIYSEALRFTEQLTRSLAETVEFHKSILTKKADYIKKQLSERIYEHGTLKEELNKLLEKEHELVKALSNETHLGGFIVIEKELQDKREERGRTGVILDEISKESHAINKLNHDIDTLRLNNQAHMEQLRANVGVFNHECKAFTRALFKDYSLSMNVDTNSRTNELEFSVVNQDKVAGDGAPRAAALAFDMAFVEYARKTKTNLPEFTLQDYLEAIDQEKLATLAHIANQRKIQVVMSILSDKLQSLDRKFIEDNTVLWLKQSDKFFKLD